MPVGAADVAPRTLLPLNEWRFALSEAATEPAAGSFDDSAWPEVTLPHTWNAFDGGSGGAGTAHYFRGTGWYRAHFTLPPLARGVPIPPRVLLEFDGASRMAEVFVNGQSLGSHIGGFARFRFDATSAVHWSGDNLVAVRVNNRTNDFIPRNGDFTMFGGLYRQARVVLTSPAHVATLDHASPGVFFTAKDLSAEHAEVEARIELANDAPKKYSGAVRVTVKAPDGTKILTQAAAIKMPPGGAVQTNLTLLIPQPHLWNGAADPYVYQATVELLDAGHQSIDAVTQPLGLRSFAVKPDAGFFLNGRHLPLHGVNRHQDWPDEGWAVATNQWAEDFSILQELGANVVRLCHYQHDQYFYDLCDHGGVAVWAECCFVNDAPLTPAAGDNAVEQMRELIRQNYNHPSIFFWSIGNETSEPRGSHAAQELLTRLAATVQAEDASRVSTYASHHNLTDPRNFIPQVLAFNKYFGWYGGEFPELGKFLDDFHAAHPEVAVGVSEYGAGASVEQHEEDPPVRKDQARGLWHPEEFQTKYHEASWLQLKDRPWLWGTFVWCLFDFASAGRNEGDTRGRNDKGLVTADRLTRKDAFYWYQANWTTRPMVHIVSKRFYDRSSPGTEIRIYSNAEAVEARLNGISLGQKTASDCRFVWPALTLKPGVNRVEAVAWKAGQPVATDSCAWTLRPPENAEGAGKSLTNTAPANLDK